MLRVTDQDDTFDSVKVGTGELGHSIDRGSSTLRVALEDEARRRVGCESGLDLADDVGGAGGGVLRIVGRVDCVVLGTARDGGADARVHGPESGGWALGFAGTTGVDDDVGRAGSALLVRHGLHGADGSEGEGSKGRLEEHCG